MEALLKLALLFFVPALVIILIGSLKNSLGKWVPRTKLPDWFEKRIGIPLGLGVIAVLFPFGVLILLDPLYLNIEAGAAGWTQLFLATFLVVPGAFLLVAPLFGRKFKIWFSSLGVVAITLLLMHWSGFSSHPPTTSTQEILRFAEEKRVAGLECITDGAWFMTDPFPSRRGSTQICIETEVHWTGNTPSEGLNRGAPVGWRYRGYNERHPQEGMFFFSLISREGTIISCDQVKCEIEREGTK